MAQVQSVWAINHWGKWGSVTYSTHQENKVKDTYYISTLCVTGLGMISIHVEFMASNFGCKSNSTQFETVVR